MGAGGVVNDSAVERLIEDRSMDRGAESASWLMLSRKIAGRMMIIAAAIF